MKTLLLTFACLIIVIESCKFQTDKNSKEFTLQGEINGQDSGMIFLSYFHENSRISDTSEIKNGKFKFTGSINEPTQANLSYKNSFSFIFLEPRKMKISISKNNLEEFEMTGSKTQNEADSLKKMEKPFYDRIFALREQRNKLEDSIKNEKDASIKSLLEKKVEEINELWSQNLSKIDSINIEFIIENQKSFVGLVTLEFLSNREIISLDSTKSIFNEFDKSIRESSRGQLIFEDLKRKENVQIGAKVPDLNIVDINNKTITLSQFNDKNFLLIDFWASWCIPCRESFPHLKEVYKRYHPKGLEIITVAWLDLNKETWIKSINEENISEWYNATTVFRNGEKTNENITDNLFIPAIPFTLLLDKTGKIIYRQVGNSKVAEESLDKILLQIF